MGAQERTKKTPRILTWISIHLQMALESQTTSTELRTMLILEKGIVFLSSTVY